MAPRVSVAEETNVSRSPAADRHISTDPTASERDGIDRMASYTAIGSTLKALGHMIAAAAEGREEKLFGPEVNAQREQRAEYDAREAAEQRGAELARKRVEQLNSGKFPGSASQFIAATQADIEGALTNAGILSSEERKILALKIWNESDFQGVSAEAIRENPALDPQQRWGDTPNASLAESNPAAQAERGEPALRSFDQPISPVAEMNPKQVAQETVMRFERREATAAEQYAERERREEIQRVNQELDLASSQTNSAGAAMPNRIAPVTSTAVSADNSYASPLEEFLSSQQGQHLLRTAPQERAERSSSDEASALAQSRAAASATTGMVFSEQSQSPAQAASEASMQRGATYAQSAGPASSSSSSTASTYQSTVATPQNPNSSSNPDSEQTGAETFPHFAASAWQRTAALEKQQLQARASWRRSLVDLLRSRKKDDDDSDGLAA